MNRRRRYGRWYTWGDSLISYHRQREAQEEAAAKKDILRLRAEEQSKREAESEQLLATESEVSA